MTIDHMVVPVSHGLMSVNHRAVAAVASPLRQVLGAAAPTAVAPRPCKLTRGCVYTSHATGLGRWAGCAAMADCAFLSAMLSYTAHCHLPLHRRELSNQAAVS
jgi:hypothetical protein